MEGGGRVQKSFSRIEPKHITGSPKKHESWNTTWKLLTDILERIKGPSNKTDMLKISVRHSILFHQGAFMHAVKKTVSLMISGTPCSINFHKTPTAAR